MANTKGRKAIPVSQAALLQVIKDLEAAQPGGIFPSRSALWDAVAQHEYAKGIGLTSQVAMLRLKAWGVEPATPKGKRGEALKQANHRPKGGPRKRKSIALPIVERLKVIMGPACHSKVDRAAAGSVKAAVALKCLDCSGLSKKEVHLCPIKECPLWAFRPYQRGVDSAD
jgi:hypothetical protein